MSTSRTYRSERRLQQAQETRLLIRTAARELFERNGFSGTTVSAIAEKAGVSVATVYAAFGTKAGILAEMMDALEDVAAGDEDPAALLSEPDPVRQLELFVHWIRTLFERGEPLLRAARSAIGDVDVAAMIKTGNERRLAGTNLLVAAWHEAGVLNAELTVQQGAQSLWLLTSAESYFNATDGLGWSPGLYEEWLLKVSMQVLFG